jgi:hypothetical protein
MTRAVPGGMLTGSHIARSLDDTPSLCVNVAGWDRAVKARRVKFRYPGDTPAGEFGYPGDTLAEQPGWLADVADGGVLAAGRPLGLAKAPSSRSRSWRMGWTRMSLPSLDSCTEAATIDTSMACRARIRPQASSC